MVSRDEINRQKLENLIKGKVIARVGEIRKAHWGENNYDAELTTSYEEEFTIFFTDGSSITVSAVEAGAISYKKAK